MALFSEQLFNRTKSEAVGKRVRAIPTEYSDLNHYSYMWELLVHILKAR
jgi:hypothetical protein